MASSLRALAFASFLALPSLAGCASGDDENATITVTPAKGGAGAGGDAGAAGQAGSAAGSGGMQAAGAPAAGSGGAGQAQGGAGQAGTTSAGGAGQGGAAGSEPAAGSGGAGSGQGGAGAGGAGESQGGAGQAQGGAGQSQGGAGSGGAPAECPPATFPSGVSIQQKKDPALQALYEALNASACSVPECFIDASDLRAADGSALTVDVKLATNFTLYELIGTDIDPNGTGAYDPANAYSARVLVSPDLVEHLQKLRDIFGGPVNITSGYRSPQHQKELCNSICGADQCTEGGVVTCAKNSRHMWGAAADMDLKYESAATQASFPFVFHESGGTGPHLHVDMQECK